MTIPGLNRGNLWQPWVPTKGILNFCVRSIPLRVYEWVISTQDIMQSMKGLNLTATKEIPMLCFWPGWMASQLNKHWSLCISMTFDVSTSSKKEVCLKSGGWPESMPWGKCWWCAGHSFLGEGAHSWCWHHLLLLTAEKTHHIANFQS